jgi:hypothetical protein
MNRYQFSRRQMLSGLGTAIALPWLESLVPVPQYAAAHAKSNLTVSQPPVRMAFLYVPNGMHMPDWKPQGNGDKFEVPAILKPIEHHRQQLNIITGLALDGANANGDGPGDHARSVASFLTGAHPKKTDGKNIRNGQSVDQLGAERIGHLTKLPSLELGTERSAPAGRCDSGYSCVYTSNLSWRTPHSPMAKEVDPAAVFDRMFGSANGYESRQAKMRRLQNRKSILDFVMQDAKRLEPTLAVGDRRKLGEFLYAVRDIERRIGEIEKLEASEEGIPDFPRPAGLPAMYVDHVELLMDMIALAFQTDTTRIISFMFANAGSNRNYPELGISSGHHDLSHHGGAVEKQKQISKINQYHVGLMGRLLDRLSEIKEGSGTLLDNCMIVYGSGIADGNSHAHKDLPIALIGSGGGTIDSGRLIRVRVGTPLTNLYCSMLDRMGINVESFSDSNGRIDDLKI